MRRFWSQPLLRQLLIAVSLLLVPLIAAMIWAAVTTFQDRVSDLRDEALVAATTTGLYVDGYLGGLDLMATALGLHPAVQGLDAAQAADLFRRTLPEQPEIVTVLLVARDRREVARSSVAEEVGTVDVEWTAAVVADKSRFVSPLQTTKQGFHSVVIGYPVRNGGGEVIAARRASATSGSSTGRSRRSRRARWCTAGVAGSSSHAYGSARPAGDGSYLAVDCPSRMVAFIGRR